jgi:hypothetical protein
MRADYESWIHSLHVAAGARARGRDVIGFNQADVQSGVGLPGNYDDA